MADEYCSFLIINASPSNYLPLTCRHWRDICHHLPQMYISFFCFSFLISFTLHDIRHHQQYSGCVSDLRYYSAFISHSSLTVMTYQDLSSRGITCQPSAITHHLPSSLSSLAIKHHYVSSFVITHHHSLSLSSLVIARHRSPTLIFPCPYHHSSSLLSLVITYYHLSLTRPFRCSPLIDNPLPLYSPTHHTECSLSLIVSPPAFSSTCSSSFLNSSQTSSFLNSH